MMKTGECLKAKREEAGLSIGEVALATKINPKVLQAIEAGDLKRLPAKTFLKGFVRAYAHFLKIDVDQVLDLFTEETGGAPPVIAHEAYRTPEPTARGLSTPVEESSAKIRTAAVCVIVLLIGAIIGIRELIEKYQREKNLVAMDAGTGDHGAGILREPSAVMDIAKFAPPAPPPPVEPKPSELKAEIAKPVEKAVEAKVEIKPEPPKRPARFELILEALQDVSLDFGVGEHRRHLKLNAGEVHVIRAVQPVDLKVSEGSALEVVFNGQSRGPAGAPGRSAQLRFP